MRKITNILGKLALSLVIAFSFGYGFYGLFTYALPMSQDNLRQARTSLVRDETEVLLNGAAKAYDEGRLDEAVRVLELAVEKVVDLGGRYNARDRWKLERAYFLLGKCYHIQEDFGKAIKNYEDTLRMNPNHMDAKYNLEMIQMQGGGGGGGGNNKGGGDTKPKI